MWTYVFTLLVGIPYLFSKGLEQATVDLGLLEQAISDLGKDGLESLSLVSVTSQPRDVLNYVLKGHSTDKCNTTFKQHCNTLDMIFSDLSFCAAGTCEKLLSDSEKQIEKFSQDLNKYLQGKSSSVEEFRVLQNLCYLLEHVSSDFIRLCAQLRHNYYTSRRQDMTDEILMRIFQTDFSSERVCMSKIQTYCPHLMEHNAELTWKCLRPKETCADLKVKFKLKCQQIGGKVKFQPSSNTSTSKVDNLLEMCHFYKDICSSEYPAIVKDCEHLEKYAEDYGIEFLTTSWHYTPLQKKPTWKDVVMLDKITREYKRSGIYVSSPYLLPVDESYLALLILGRNGTSDKAAACKEALEENCGIISTFSSKLRNFCLKKDIACNGFTSKLVSRCEIFTKWLVDSNITNATMSAANGNSGFVSWFKLQKISLTRCSTFESECYYLADFCPGVKVLCDNLRLACYKEARMVVANRTVKAFVRGFLNKLRKADCKEKFLENCNKFEGYYMVEVLDSCLEPEKTCKEYQDGLEAKCKGLSQDLIIYAPNPKPDQCEKYGDQCSTLAADCLHAQPLCYVLEDSCNRLQITSRLMYDMIPLRTDAFYSKYACLRQLEKHCPRWRLENKCSYIDQCRMKERTCADLIHLSKDVCDAFLENFEANRVIQEALEKPSALYCIYWEEFCDMLVRSCFSQLYQMCVALATACEKYHLTDSVIYALAHEIKGGLGSKSDCLSSVDKYCEKTKNKTFLSLCDNDKNIDAVQKAQKRETLCQKLLEYVYVYCLSAEDEFKRGIRSLVKALSLLKETSSINALGFAFDVSTVARTQCKHLSTQCVFQRECDSIKRPCKTVERLCKEIDNRLMAGVLKNKTETVTITRVSETCKPSNHTSDIVGDDASLHSESLQRWVLCFFVIAITVFTAIFA